MALDIEPKLDKVLCVTWMEERDIPDPHFDQIWEQENWLDYNEISAKYPPKPEIKKQVLPLIDHPHSDKENGQIEIHYHIDTRYMYEQNHLSQGTEIAKFGHSRISVDKKGNLHPFYSGKGMVQPKFDYFMLEKTDKTYRGITPTGLIKNSKLKHKCIHNGKCPHRGFDLSNVKPINGVITCPLHGLQFDAKSKKLLNDPTNESSNSRGR